MFADTAAVIAIVLCAGVALLCIADLYLIAVHLGRGAREITKERARLCALAPNADSKPSVCVQLTVFNEPRSVGAAIDALCALDWPRDRLEIMILDDSTDETWEIAAERLSAWQGRGINVAHRRRAHRGDYKAGALAEAFAETSAEYIAIFDVDYRPARDFLHKTMSALTGAPRAAFVQTRLDYRNRNSNVLTRAQAMQLDLYYAYEQAGRIWAGIPTPFNGTCAVWRRAAIDEAGGWSGHSVAEDLDVSLRAFGNGWVSLNLVTVAVEGELPESLDALVSQRRRWALGTSQTFRTLPWNLLHYLRWDQAVVFTLLSLNHAGLSIALQIIFLAAVSSWLAEPATGTVALIAFAAVVTLIIGLKDIGAALACRATGRGIRWDFLPDLVCMWTMDVCMVPIRSKAQVEGLLGRRIPFIRTPKRG